MSSPTRDAEETLTPASTMMALDAIYRGDWSTIVTTWGEGHIVEKLWRTLFLASDDWMQTLSKLIENRPTREPFHLLSARGLSSLNWNVGAQPGLRWLYLIDLNHHFLRAERRMHSGSIIPRSGPYKESYNSMPWTSWHPRQFVHPTDGRSSSDFSAEQILGTL